VLKRGEEDSRNRGRLVTWLSVYSDRLQAGQSAAHQAPYRVGTMGNTVWSKAAH